MGQLGKDLGNMMRIIGIDYLKNEENNFRIKNFFEVFQTEESLMCYLTKSEPNLSYRHNIDESFNKFLKEHSIEEKNLNSLDVFLESQSDVFINFAIKLDSREDSKKFGIILKEFTKKNYIEKMTFLKFGYPERNVEIFNTEKKIQKKLDSPIYGKFIISLKKYQYF